MQARRRGRMLEAESRSSEADLPEAPHELAASRGFLGPAGGPRKRQRPIHSPNCPSPVEEKKPKRGRRKPLREEEATPSKPRAAMPFRPSRKQRRRQSPSASVTRASRRPIVEAAAEQAPEAVARKRARSGRA